MSNKEAVYKLLNLLKPHLKTIFLIIACLIFSIVINLCIPIITRDLMDQGLIGQNKSILLKLTAAILILSIVNELINIYKEKKRIVITSEIRYTLSSISFRHIIKLHIKHFNNTNNSELLNNIEVDILNICSIADGSMFFAITQIFSIIGGIIGLFIINKKLVFIILLFIPIKFLLAKEFAKKRKIIMDYYINEQGDFAKWFGDTVTGVKEIKFFGIQKYKMDEFISKQKNIIQYKKKLDILSQLNTSYDSILLSFITSFIYVAGANMIFSLELTVGSIFAFITFSALVTSPISSILNIGYYLSGVLPSTKRFYEFMELEEELQEERLNDKGIIEYEFNKMEFKKVNFSYNDNHCVLNDINFKVSKGNKIAIIGANGSGKTTVVQLLLRMYEVNGGDIFINNINIKEFEINKYRELYSVVNQQIYLFNTTIYNNICLYKDISIETLMEAVKDSGLSEFIQEKSLQYVVGENGVMLSGGQKQKIAFARALVHDKPILIFDEATSNTDIFSELHINKILNSKLKMKTVFIVTHKPEILDSVDFIIHLHNGELIGFGSYEELFENSKEFKKMIELYYNK